MFQRLRPYLSATNGPIILAMLALMAVSLLAIRAAEAADPLLAGATVHQAVSIGVALAAFVLAGLIPLQRIGRYAYLLFGLNLALLVLVLLLPGPGSRGSHRWIRLGSIRTFQPSELAKLTYIMAMAAYLRYRENYRRLLGLVPPFLLTLLPAALILIEPDLGTTLLLFPTLFFMLFMAGAKLKHLLAVVAVASAAVFLPLPHCLDGADADRAAEEKALAYWSGDIFGKEYAFVAAPLRLMKPHQVSRIEGWLNQSDPRLARREGFQLRQSMVIVGSGGRDGYRMPEVMDLFLRRLPDDHTDFIFAVVGGQWGFRGCLGVLLIYGVIFVCGAEIATLTKDPFGRLLVVGALALLFAQIFINVGMTVGLMPITGMTLPLVSFGGSSLLVNAMALGLLVNVSQHRPRMLGRKPFEHDAKAPEEEAAYKRPMEPLDAAANQPPPGRGVRT
jgi:rod shape determining protein RodA